jgi:hypothetical protein
MGNHITDAPLNLVIHEIDSLVLVSVFCLKWLVHMFCVNIIPLDIFCGLKIDSISSQTGAKFLPRLNCEANYTSFLVLL